MKFKIVKYRKQQPTGKHIMRSSYRQSTRRIDPNALLLALATTLGKSTQNVKSGLQYTYLDLKKLHNDIIRAQDLLTGQTNQDDPTVIIAIANLSHYATKIQTVMTPLINSQKWKYWAIAGAGAFSATIYRIVSSTLYNDNNDDQPVNTTIPTVLASATGALFMNWLLSDQATVELGEDFYEFEKLVLSLQWVQETNKIQDNPQQSTVEHQADRTRLAQYVAIHDCQKVSSSASLAVQLINTDRTILSPQAQSVRDKMLHNTKIAADVLILTQLAKSRIITSDIPRAHELIERISLAMNRINDHDTLLSVATELGNTSPSGNFLKFILNQGTQKWAADPDFPVFKVLQMQLSLSQALAVSRKLTSVDQARCQQLFSLADYAGQRPNNWDNYKVPAWFSQYLAQSVDQFTGGGLHVFCFSTLQNTLGMTKMTDHRQPEDPIEDAEWITLRLITNMRLDQNTRIKHDASAQKKIASLFQSIAQQPGVQRFFGTTSQMETDYFPELFLRLISQHCYNESNANKAKAELQDEYVDYVEAVTEPLMGLATAWLATKDIDPSSHQVVNFNPLIDELLKALQENNNKGNIKEIVQVVNDKRKEYMEQQPSHSSSGYKC